MLYPLQTVSSPCPGVGRTLNEITNAVIQGKPIVFLRCGGGFVDKFLDAGFQNMIQTPYAVSIHPKDAVEEAVLFASEQNTSKH